MLSCRQIVEWINSRNFCTFIIFPSYHEMKLKAYDSNSYTHIIYCRKTFCHDLIFSHKHITIHFMVFIYISGHSR